MKNNSKLGFTLLSLAGAMLLLAFAAAPIYSLFCKVTGYAGNVIVTKTKSEYIGNRNITIKFDSNIDQNLNWAFRPKQKEIRLKTGENVLVFYNSENLSDKDITGIAIYNVSPFLASKYFNKIECFCFEEQTLKSRQKKLMPVSFFIDPTFDTDPEMSDVNTLTLSYTFYKIEGK